MQRENLILINMISAIAMIMIDQTVVGIILPSLQRSFQFSPTELQWVVNSYTLALGALLICGGWAGDRFGRFKSFAFGASVFALASLGCALAPNGETMLAARVGQGIGAAFMQPAASAIVFSAFPADKRGRAMSLYVSAGLLFLAVGPLVGGALIEHTSWHAVFLINVPIGLMAAVAALILGKGQPAAESGDDRKTFDIKGAVLLVIGTASLTFAIQELGDGNRSAAALLLVGVAAFGFLYARYRRVQNSIVDFGLLSDRQFAACCALFFCMQFAILAKTVYGAIFMQNVLGLSPLQTGLATLPVVVMIAISSRLAGYAFTRVNFRTLAAIGTGVNALGYCAQAAVFHLEDIRWLIPGLILGGSGAGLVAGILTTYALGRVDAAKRSAASGMLQTLSQIGGVIGIACIGGVINFIEKARIADEAHRLGGSAEKQAELQMLLFQAEEGMVKAISELQREWPSALADLKLITIGAITQGYLLGAAVLGLGLLISLWAFPARAPVETGARHGQG